jgi:hypothetical protein
VRIRSRERRVKRRAILGESEGPHRKYRDNFTGSRPLGIVDITEENPDIVSNVQSVKTT